MRSRIFIKFVCAISLVVTLSMSILAAFFLTYFKDFFEDILVNNSREAVLKMTNEVTDNLEEMVAYGQVIALDDTIQYTLENAEKQKNTYEYYYMVQEAKNVLKEYINLKSNNLYDIVLIDRDGNILEMNNNYDRLFDNEKFADLYKQEENSFIPLHVYTYNAYIGTWDTFSYACSVYSKDDYTYIGKLLIIMRYDNMLENLLDFDEYMDVDISLYNDDDLLMYASDYQRDLEQEYRMSVQQGQFQFHQNSYLFNDELGFNNWRAVYSISGSSIEKSMNQMFQIIIIALIFSLLLILVVVYKLVRGILKPLDKVVASMRRVSQGDHYVQVQVNSGDEIEEVANVFNDMVTDIANNTHMLIESQKREQDAQIRMLIYQINPHFIYNTLNCVICLARKGDDDKIVVLVRTFIELLRSTLKSGVENYVTIEEEKDYINHYIDVLRYSYHNIPEIQWYIEPGLENEKILKQIIYPLVENSVFHGLLPVEELGEIYITIERVGDEIEVTEYDNGRGMTEKELAALKKSLHEVTKEIVGGEHIGLRNVNNRLNLIYGEESRIKVESEFGKGTMISFRYPAQRPENNNNE
jgi:two-component system sensor histidine kinase YesM